MTKLIQTTRASLLLITGLALTQPSSAAADAQAQEPFNTPPAVSKTETTEAVQVTEIGLMRVLVVFEEGLDPSLVKIVNQRLSDVHFRVFPSAERADGTDKAKLRTMGEKAGADLVLHAALTVREKKKFGSFSLHEGEATVEIISPVTGEILVTHTDRAVGIRKADEVEARRSATENVLNNVVKEAATKALEKSDKILIYEVEIGRVPSNMEILKIKDHIAKLKGVYHVRELSYDPAKKLAVLEIQGGPKMQTFLKAHIENYPSKQVPN